MSELLKDININRRGLIGTLGALGAAVSLPVVTQAATKTNASRRPLDFLSSKDNLFAYIKMIGDVAGKVTVGTLSGHIFGVVGNDIIKPLFGFKGFGTGRTEYRPDGTVQVSWREVAFYTDLVTGAVLEKWRNPYSNELVDVMPVQNDPVNFLLSETINVPPPNAPRQFRAGNYANDGKFIMPWFIDHAGDWASIMYDVHGTRPNPFDAREWPRESSGRPSVRVSEFFQYGAKLSELENPKLTSVRYVGGWQRIADWLPWMLMGDLPGHLMYRSVTRKLNSVNELDPLVLSYTKANFPKYLVPPEKWSNENVSSFDVYKTLHKPAAQNK